MLPEQRLFTAAPVYQDGTIVVCLTGELDIATAPTLRHTIDRLLTLGVPTIVLDLANLDFVDVAGLRAVLHAQRSATSHHAELRIRAVNEFTAQVIQLVNFADLDSTIDTAARTQST